MAVYRLCDETTDLATLRCVTRCAFRLAIPLLRIAHYLLELLGAEVASGTSQLFLHLADGFAQGSLTIPVHGIEAGDT